MRGLSTRLVAEDHGISQTRVRQIVGRVLDWIAATLPDKPEADEKQELRLAQHIAADRIQQLYSELMLLWRQRHEPKFMGQLMRITLAAGRLGVIPGTIDALAADAIEGPYCGAGVSPASHYNPTENTALNQPDTRPTNPPPGDCSPISAVSNPAPHNAETALVTKSFEPETSDAADAGSASGRTAAITNARPLLSTTARLPVTGLHIAPDQPGAVTLDAICRRLEEKKRGTPRRVAR